MYKLKHFFLTAVTLLCSLAVNAQDFQVDGIYYNVLSYTTVSVTYLGAHYDHYPDEYSGEVIIPSIVSYRNTEFEVTEIGPGAFSGCTNLTSVSIPNSVTKIGDYAFSGCSGITHINVPKDAGLSGIYSFQGCTGELIMNNNRNVSYQTGTGSNTTYGPFYGSEFTKVTIGDDVTTLMINAFWNCTSIKEVVIPENVTKIEKGAFYGCTGIANITCHAVNPPTCGTDVFYQVDKSIPVYVPAESIEAYKAAEYWNEFTNIQAISSDLASGTCGDNLTWRLTEEYELVIEGTGEMYDYTSGSQPWYEYRESIQTITMSESVTSIGDAAFSGCSSLTAINVAEGNVVYDSRGGCNAIIETNSNTLIAGCSTTIIPESVTSIGNYAFLYCSSLTTITIPEGVTSIGDGTFGWCSSLTSIIIPKGVTSIGTNAFYGCENLTYITIPKSVTSIGWGAFYGCKSLTSITIPEGLTTIGSTVFYGCEGLASFTIPMSVTSIGTNAFCHCNGLTSIICRATTPPTIVYSTFDEVDKSIPLYVPENSVEAYQSAQYWSEFTNFQPLSNDIAFGTCGDNLTWRLTEEYELVIEGTGEMYDGSSWEGYEEVVKSITIREGVTSIGDICFWNFSNLKVLTIPGSLTKIGGNPFYGCTELYTILLQSANPVYDTYDGNVVEKNSGTVVIGCRHVPAYSSVTKVGDFAYCGRGLSSIVIPENITSIGYAAFSENEDMTSITIPESVTSIGDHAFANCQKLTSVNIPEGVTKIGDWTFLQCYSLASIEIPSSVTELGNLAFGLCESVTSITCKATNPPAAGNSFQGVDKSTPVYVPAGSVAAYKAANDWSEFTNILPIENPTLDYVTITINQYGSGTYSSSYALDFSEVKGLKAYAAAGYDTETGVVTLLRVNTAKAGIGLFVKGTPGETYEVPVIESTSSNVLNMLAATLVKTSVNAFSDDERYANYKYTVLPGDTEPLFHQFADGSTLSAGKAYLQIPVDWLPAKVEKARSIRLRFDNGDGTYDDEGTTSIDNSQLTIDNAEIIYDLMGRRVTSPQKGGLYIIGGKKVIY